MSKKPIIAFTCPTCGNRTVYSIEQDVRITYEVRPDEVFVCEECAGEFKAKISKSGSSIKLIRIED